MISLRCCIRILLLVLAPLPSVCGSDLTRMRDLEKSGFVLELLWWPAYCHDHPQLKHCAGADFRGFVLGAVNPLLRNSHAAACPMDGSSFRPDDRLLRVMPDETLLERQWRLYGACSGLTQVQYFEFLLKLSRSVRIPDMFVLPRDHFEISADRVKQEFLRKNPRIKPSYLTVFCKLGFLGEIRVASGAEEAKPEGSCEQGPVKVIARMPLAE